MDSTADMEWLTPFLSRLRCPNTHEPLRLATDAEKQQFGAASEAAALINHGGTHLYPVLAGIPHLLPSSALVLA